MEPLSHEVPTLKRFVISVIVKVTLQAIIQDVRDVIDEGVERGFTSGLKEKKNSYRFT